MLKKSLPLLLFSSALFAADSDVDLELDAVIQGFEDSSPAPQDNQLDEILEGFEDTAPKKADDGLSDILEGFEDTTPESNGPSQASDASQASPWDMTTLLSLSASYNYQHTEPANNQTDYRGLSRLKLKLQPEVRYAISSHWDTLISASGFYDFAYRINDRDNYTSQVLDTYESELELREAYIRGTVTSAFDVTVGRQIVVWGKADSVRVVDVLNPLDFREPGMIDIEDLRLPVFMIKGDYYVGDWNLSAIAIPEIRMNKNPAYGSDFYFGDPSKPEPQESIPDDIDNFEYALALKGRFQGWDLSFHSAYIYDDQPYIKMVNNSPTLHHARVTMAGVAGNVAIGNWMLKAELALLDGIKFSQTDETYTRTDLMLGFDYAGINDTTLSIESVTRHLLSYDALLKNMPDDTDETEGQVFFRYTGTFLREKLQLVALISLLGLNTHEGAFYRGSAKYELMDAMSLELGGIVYQSGDSRLSKVVASNDRVFMDLRYSF